MGLAINDNTSPSTIERQRSSESASSGLEASPVPPQQQPITRRRTVECAMAWELDCVASGVVPLDHDHVLLLGIVPPADDEEEDLADPPGNDLELQIISKADGSILFSNVLPLLRDEPAPQQLPLPHKQIGPTVVVESAADYRLLSSFATPRMDDAYEASAEEESTPDDEFDVQVSLFSPTTHASRRFVDPYLKWSLTGTAFTNENIVMMSPDENLAAGNTQHLSDNDDDSLSVDSDDYGFIFRSLPTTDGAPSQLAEGVPPLILVTSRSDAVLARMRDVDDAISHALASGKSALALKRALCQKRRVRKFKLSDLVNEYFASLLRIPTGEVIGDGQRTRALSIRRLKLAARAMPVLFGGEIKLWKRWIAEVQKIPGGLFVLSDQIPVRGKSFLLTLSLSRLDV
jgi:vacuolar protein sorting-associated protein 41